MLAKKHGPLMTIKLGTVTTIVASSAEMAREILQKNDEACSGRFVPDAVTALHNYDLAVIWISAVLKPLDPQNLRRKAKVSYDWLSDEICQGFIDERLKERMNNGKRYGDFLDSLIDYSEEKGSQFNLDYIRILLVDIFIAATETNSSTTGWAMSELVLHQDIMVKLRQEITNSVKENGSVTSPTTLPASSYKRDYASPSTCPFTRTS